MIKGLMYLEIGGEQKGLQFGMYALKVLTEKRGVSINDLNEIFIGIEEDLIKGMDLIIDLIYAGMTNYNLVNSKSDYVNYYQLYNDFPKIDTNDIPKIIEAFTSTLNIGGAVEKSNNDMDKPADSKKK